MASETNRTAASDTNSLLIEATNPSQPWFVRAAMLDDLVDTPYYRYARDYLTHQLRHVLRKSVGCLPLGSPAETQLKLLTQNPPKSPQEVIKAVQETMCILAEASVLCRSTYPTATNWHKEIERSQESAAAAVDSYWPGPTESHFANPRNPAATTVLIRATQERRRVYILVSCSTSTMSGSHDPAQIPHEFLELTRDIRVAMKQMKVGPSTYEHNQFGPELIIQVPRDMQGLAGIPILDKLEELVKARGFRVHNSAR